ncbi:MAG: co-chaperone GroES [Planctomycetes bacterium]|nr:co-chaperone GroES [Planctomycetota bacterium]
MSKPKVKPLNDKILVRRAEAEEKTRGGIILPETAKEKPREGVVVALGDGPVLEGGKRGTFQVRENDRIIFTSYAGTEIKVEGQEYLILSEDDVLAVVE